MDLFSSKSVELNNMLKSIKDGPCNARALFQGPRESKIDISDERRRDRYVTKVSSLDVTGNATGTRTHRWMWTKTGARARSWMCYMRMHMGL